MAPSPPDLAGAPSATMTAAGAVAVAAAQAADRRAELREAAHRRVAHCMELLEAVRRPAMVAGGCSLVQCVSRLLPNWIVPREGNGRMVKALADDGQV